jgi:cytochrome c peroxidase
MRVRFICFAAAVVGLAGSVGVASQHLAQGQGAPPSLAAVKPTALQSTDWPVPRGLHEPLTAPAANALTTEKVALGRRLFSSTQLSRTTDVSCATCHDPARAFSDARTIAVGIAGRIGTRHAPALINRGFGASFFWDGRALSLEAQVVMPIADENEMDFSVSGAVARLQGDPTYVSEFAAAFGRPVNSRDLANALASFVRSIVSGDSRVDRYLDGDDSALSATEVRGLRVFRGRGLCTACHKGGNFTDEAFHNTGVAWVQDDSAAGGKLSDRGRATVTNRASDEGAFRTPTLREISRTAPYMHDGSLPTLEAVVDFYDRGGRSNPNLDRDLMPLRLSAADKSALVDFMKALNGRPGK